MEIVRDVAGGCRVEVSVQPGARRSGVVGLHGDSVKISLVARPVDGEANEGLRRFLADFAGVAFSAVSIERGEKSRRKSVLLAGVTAAALAEKLKEAGIDLPNQSEGMTE